MSHPSAIFLMGPTASGKTDLAMKICEHFPCEIISVDSALVYKGMDIGTAKPTEQALLKAPHRLINLCDPAESYSAAQFRADALQEMASITADGKTPLLVGGSMLYFKTLLEGMADLPPADPAIRRVIEQQAAQHGWPFVHQQLAGVDPASAARIHPNHSQRIERALEVYRLTGITMTELYARQVRDQPLPYRVSQIAIAPVDRSVLHRRIESRFLSMMEQGFVKEVRGLYQRGDLNPNMPSIRAVGYRQVWDYLDGKLDYDGLIERGIIATRQLAKRQLTWLRNWPDLQWIYTDEQNRVAASMTEGYGGQSPYDLAKEFLDITPT